MLLYIAITQSAFSLGEMIDICPCLCYILTPPSAGGLYRLLHGRGGAGGDQVHVLRGLQHLLHPVRQGWVMSRAAGGRGEYCAAEGRVEGRGCSAVDRVCVGEELGQGGGQQSRHLDTAQGECRGRYSVEAGVDIVPPRLPHLARLPGPGAGGTPGAAQGQGL